MTGKEMKKFIKDSGVLFWKVADKLGIADTTLSRHLRYDFTEQETAEIKKAVAELKAAD